MNASTIKYQILKPDTHLDCAEFSLCPNCSLHIIKLADGCSLCGWSEGNILQGGLNKSSLHSSSKKFDTLEQELAIPCLIKRPKQPEVKGIIQKDLGDRFLVEVDGKSISVSKLFVYPEFSTVKQHQDKSDLQIPPTKQAAPPSKSGATPRRRKTHLVAHQDSSPTKPRRRKKGDGTGYIYRRTVTKRGKQYQESYFRYRDESGKLKAKYIPQKLLSKVEEAESAKNKIADILFLLGGDEISRGEHSSTSDDRCVRTDGKNDELIFVSRGEQPAPPSKRKRKQGEGTGYIECKPISRNGKEYKQYWYHYEEWREGDCVVKKSRYIPKRLVAKVERMEADKVSVGEILKVLISKGKKS